MTPDQLKYLTDDERRAWEVCSGPAWVLSDDSEPHRIGRGSHPGAYPTDAVPFVVGLDAAGQRHMPSLTDLQEMVAVRTALPAALEALADARRDLAWHETRHGTRAEQEADDAADAAEEERQKSLTDEQVHAELTALGVDILASRARFDGTLRLCSMLADARRERDEWRQLVRIFLQRWNLNITDGQGPTGIHRETSDAILSMYAALRASETPGGDPAPRGAGAPDAAGGALGVGAGLTNCDNCAHDYGYFEGFGREVHGCRRLDNDEGDYDAINDWSTRWCSTRRDARPDAGATGCPGWAKRGEG